MKSRDNKPNYAGAYFHVYNRGVAKQIIFKDDQDYENFLYRANVLLGTISPPKRTSKGSIRFKVLPIGALEVMSYCLMPNHFHFLLKQNQVDGLKIFMHRLCTSYSMYFNKKYSRVGHIFQDIFKCKNILEDSYLTQLTAYIHLNPEYPFDWKYSSLPIYLGKAHNTLASPDFFMKMHNLTKQNYQFFLSEQYNFDKLQLADVIFDD